MVIKSFAMDESMTSTVSGEASNSSNTPNDSSSTATTNTNTISFSSPNQAQPPPPPPPKKKRNLPGNPDPDAEVISLSPKSLLATNRFICEICGKGFQRDQNLQLHRRGHNLPWKLKQRANKDQIRKKVYVCPEPSCVHHEPSRALGDLTGIKKHYCRKHGEKKWKCDKCSKKYAVQSDWKAHSKICGTKEYRCDCGTIFSRRDSFITHRAFCDALAQESAKAINPITIPSLPQLTISTTLSQLSNIPPSFQSLPLKREQHDQHLDFCARPEIPPWLACQQPHAIVADNNHNQYSQQVGSGPPHPEPHSHMDHIHFFSFQQYDGQHDPSSHLDHIRPTLSSFQISSPPQMSATALLQKATQIGVTVSQEHHQHQHQHYQQPQSHTQMSHDLSSSHESNHHNKQVMTNESGFIQGHVVSTSAGGQSLMLHDMLIMNSFQGVTASKPQPLPPPPHDGGKGGGDGLTRDFLGLRTFSHKDFLNMAALGHMTSSTSSFDHRQQHDQDHQGQTPW